MYNDDKRLLAYIKKGEQIQTLYTWKLKFANAESEGKKKKYGNKLKQVAATIDEGL